MRDADCRSVRDRLPELAAAEITGDVARRLGAHIGECADCRTELDLVRRMREERVAPPAALERRVARAVATSTYSASRSRPAPRHFALAASVAFALLTGALFVTRYGPVGAPRAQKDSVSVYSADVQAPSLIGWTASGDPLLQGAPALHDLSVDELETLLAELQS